MLKSKHAYTDIILLESVYRSSEIPTNTHSMSGSTKVNPPSIIAHTNKYESEAFTTWVHARYDWLLKLYNKKIVKDEKMIDWEHFDKWAEFYDSKYIQIYNVWLPISELTLAFPLIFCSKDSVDNKDIIPILHKIPVGDTNYIYDTLPGLKYNKNEKWYYYPKFKRGECVIFDPIRTPHTATKLSDSSKYPPRQSIEFRFGVFNFFEESKLLKQLF